MRHKDQIINGMLEGAERKVKKWEEKKLFKKFAASIALRLTTIKVQIGPEENPQYVRLPRRGNRVDAEIETDGATQESPYPLH